MPKLIWSQTALKDMAKLEKVAAKRIMEKLEVAAMDPNRYFQRLSGMEEEKLRVGDYRILVQLAGGGDTILVERVGHRKNVYKRLV